MWTSFRAAVAGVALTLCVVMSASAAPVTFSFTAMVSDDPYGLSSFGAPITGSYTFDSAATDADASGAIGSYVSVGPAFGFQANVDGTDHAVTGTIHVGVQNGGVAFYTVTAGDPSSLLLELTLTDLSGSALSDDSLPLVPPALSGFPSHVFRLYSPDAEFAGVLTTLACTAGCEVVAVPEPGAFALAGIALLMAWRCRRR